MKKILVTGATGFVGRRLVSRLVGEDCRVRVLVRDPVRLEPGLANRVEIVIGCLGDEATARQATAGVDTVLHLAALATAYVRDPRRYFTVNTDGLQVLLEAAAQAKVRQFVHVSSVAAVPPKKQLAVPGLSGEPTPYAQSKMASEKLVELYVRQGGKAVIVRPSRVYGPGPWNDANGTTRLAAMYLRGTFRFRLRDQGARANYVHVDDVVDGIIRAGCRGRSGAAYMLGGQDATLEQYLQVISGLSGIQRRVWSVPPAVMVPVAQLCQFWGYLGGTASLTPAWLNNFLEDRPVDSGRAARDLGYHPRNLRDGLSQTLAWLMTDPEGGQDVDRKPGPGKIRPSRMRLRKNWA